MAFEKISEACERFWINRTKKLWDKGYNSMQISEKTGRPIEKVQEWIRLIVAADKAAQ